jgi:predicted transposase YbfD/YdcC
VHLLSAFVVKNQCVINQLKMNEGENEITAALSLIKNTPVDGENIDGDAIFGQKKSAKRF